MAFFKRPKNLRFLISNFQFPITKNEPKTTTFSQKSTNFKSKKGRRANAPKDTDAEGIAPQWATVQKGRLNPSQVPAVDLNCEPPEIQFRQVAGCQEFYLSTSL